MIRWTKPLLHLRKFATASCLTPASLTTARRLPMYARMINCRAFGTAKDSSHLDRIKAHIDLMEELTCSGCGIEMQFKDELKVGYCSTKALEAIKDVHDISSKLICQRCFQIRNYGKITDSKMPYDEYEKSVKALKPRDMLMIQLVDVLDITGSLLGSARHVVGRKPVLLVVNKGDLIPPKSGVRRLLRSIKSAAEEQGIENIIGIRLISSAKGTGIEDILSDIKKYRQGRDVCVIGAANVGKSTFLNALLAHSTKSKRKVEKMDQLPDIDVADVQPDTYGDVILDEKDHLDVEVLTLKEKKQLSKQKSDAHLTTSSLPGTTLAVSPIPFTVGKDTFNILDTPGLIVNRKRQKLIEILSRPGSSELTSIIPGKKLPATLFKVTPGRSLFLGAMLRFDYELANESGKNNALLFSWYGLLPGHLCKTANAADTFLKHAGGMLAPPRSLDALSYTGPLLHRGECHLKEFAPKDVWIRSSNPKRPKRTTVVELVVPGFGWLGITGVDLDGSKPLEKTMEEARIQMWTCEGLEARPRRPIFPSELSTVTKQNWKE
ncbi:hypothetical protein LEN26_001477 [Aphanomyces euteiches]|nr:hypothetical protein LEN26_001477 [Aphanomyces euteiches]